MPSDRSVHSLHIIGGTKLGGAELFYVRLVNALAERGESAGAVVVPGGEIDAALSPQVIRQYAPLSGIWDLWSRFRLGKIVRDLSPAIVQTYMGRATRLTHLQRGKRPVHVARLGGYYNLKGYRHAHAWIGNTQGICDYLVRGGLPHERVFHIGNFVDAAARHSIADIGSLKDKWQIPADAHVILGLGRLHPNKGFGDLLQAFSRLPGNLHDRPLQLVMVGDGPLGPELRNMASQLGIADRVTWAGWQYTPSIWYQMADVFVCSSRHEPLGNVVLEAWANGTPVVSTQAEGPQEIVSPGDDALLVPVANPIELANGILEMLRLDATARLALTNAGKAKIESEFSETAIVAAYKELYGQLSN